MEDVSDDALVDRGVDSESGLAEIEAEVSRLPPEVVAAARGLRRSAAKLVVNIALGIAGIALAPPTFAINAVWMRDILPAHDRAGSLRS
jgi:hypothetical protein